MKVECFSTDAFVNNMADLDPQQGRLRDAQRWLCDGVRQRKPLPVRHLIFTAETFALVIGRGIRCCVRPPTAVLRRQGRLRAYPIVPPSRPRDERALAPIKVLVTKQEWDDAIEQGHRESLSDLVDEMADLPPLTADLNGA
jgi:hypothetical protein